MSERQDLPAGIGLPAWSNAGRDIQENRGVVGYSVARQYIQDALYQSDDVYHLFSQNGSGKPPKKSRRRKPASIRLELVERVRREIADGTYDTQEKWEAALDKLLEHLAD